MFCQLGRPGIPACALVADHIQLNAVDGAHRYAQLTACAVLGDDGVHLLVGTQDGIGGARFNAQRAANAPVLVNARQR